MSHRLIIVEGPDKGRIFEVSNNQKIVIGRGDASDTKINDDTMSRVHCEFSLDNGHGTVTDKGSAGGTFVDGAKVESESVPVSLGQLIQVGSCAIRFEIRSSNTTQMHMGSEEFDVKPLRDLVKTELGPYKLDKIIGAGATGMLFKGTHSESGVVAAIKVLSPEYTSDDDQRQRFVRAMKTMLPLESPYIIKLLNAGKNGPYCWAAMDLIEGESLTQKIDRIGIEGMLDWKKVWRVAAHIARALHAGYENKVIHRNVTPNNIMQRSSDQVCLLGDFMLAKALEGTNAKQITQPGQLIGDVPYMAPERTKDGSEVDTRSDIYGLGATCYALLTGKPPAEGETLPQIVDSVRNGTPKNPKESQLSINENFASCVMQMIAKDPADRYQTPSDLVVELEQIGKFNALSAS